MILETLLAGALVGGAVYAYKHYATAAQVAAVKAEVAKLEAEAVALEASVKPYALGVISRLKAKL
jgi:cell division protein FtsB